jgi:hypothetical protein
LLLGGILFFAGTYGTYARVLGWIDGLPQVPERFLRRQAGNDFQPPKKPISPTVQKIREAFGPDCPEQLTAFYPTQLEFRNRETSVVLAAGPTPLSPGTNRIVLAPFSLAVFGKPKPDHLRKAGEVVEISTFHADKAVLEFDQPINTPQDMKMDRLVRVELITEPEQALPDPRRGMIHITNNQKSADPSKFFVLRTPGPVFYRNAKHAGAKAESGPDIWTDAPVEIVNRQNIPRRREGVVPATAPVKGEQLRAEGAVPAILNGQRLPPPTVTAVGMRIFLEPQKKNEPPSVQAAKKDSGLNGVRRVELLEKVLFNLWVNAKQGISSSPGRKDAAAPEASLTTKAAVAGALLFADPAASRPSLALLQVETLGPFAYDVPKNLARFDVVPQADPNIPNDVQVTRMPPAGERQRLFTQVLEVEFADRLAGGPSAEAREPKKGPDAAQTGGLSFKRLHAWTYTPGRFLTLSTSEFDERGNEFAGMEAFGQDLVHEQAENRSTLIGSPLYLVRTNKPRPGERPGESKPGGSHVLSAGAAQQPATLVLEPDSTPDHSLMATIRGKGRMDLFDPGTQANTLQTTWDTSLVLSKEFVRNRERDVLTFTDGAKFEDKKAGFWLKGNTIKVWIEGKGIDDGLTTNSRSQALPHRIQAIGAVSGHSTEFDIERADHLNVLFEDGLPPPAPKRDEPLAAALPAPPMTAPVGPPMPPAAAPPKETPAPKQPPKPPMKLNARVIDTLVDRYPSAGAAKPKADADPGAGGSMKYELKKAWCEGPLVVSDKVLPLVHQNPTSPEKPRGLDIYGLNLLLDHTPDGSVMTVNGNEEKPGEVHHERTSILGPKVVIDQIHNRVIVEGRGSLVMPAGSELNGRDLEPRAKDGKPSQTVVVVHWRDGMEFNGAKKTAEFLGRVRAVQNEASVVCHTMQVIFDRPVYFNQMKKPGDRPSAAAPGAPGDPKASGNPRIELDYCYPAPEDAPDEPKGSNTVTYSEIVRDRDGKIVRSQFVTARELVMTANARDDGQSQPYQEVVGHGPGTVRIWQPGEKEVVATPGSKPAPGTPQTEMKLTIVQFGGRMTAADKGKKLQTATFTDSIEVIHAPTDDPAARIDRHHMPQGAVRMTCADKLVVSTYKAPNAAQATQRMDAYGNAFIRSDEYDGWGEEVKSDGRYVELIGKGDTLAQIYNRFNETRNSGRKIVYDRQTGAYHVDGSFGGTIENRPKAPPPPPPKK